jgi:hypothetical protein
MIRVEIIANHSVEENILEAFQAEGVAKYYTKFPTVFGVGSSGPRMGDAVWPEENFCIAVWCEKEEAESIERALAAVKQQFPDEGIKLFKLEPPPPPEPQIITVPQVLAVPPVPPSAGPAWAPADIIPVLPVLETDPEAAEPAEPLLESRDPEAAESAEEARTTAPAPPESADKLLAEEPLSRSEQEQLWVSAPPVQGMEEENS